MSTISKLITNRTVKFEHPEIEGFIVTLAYINREDIFKVRNSSLTFKMNKATRQREETIDNDRFLEEYTRRAIKNWEGLKVKHLPKLLPVDISNMNPDEEVVFSEEDAIELMKNSSVFDAFITDCMNDYEQFSVKKKEDDQKN